MKWFIVLFLSFKLLATASGQDSVGGVFTNNVLISDSGLSFGLCNLDRAPGPQAFLQQKEILADEPLSWFLYSPSNLWSSAVFIGMSNSFAFDLKTPAGIPVSKTAKGTAMNAGPVSLTDLNANKFVRRIGGGFVDFPKLAELFEFPSNGVYVLEVRYWVWSNRKFSLSNPIRMKVTR